jgi:hypothetical protein
MDSINLAIKSKNNQIIELKFQIQENNLNINATINNNVKNIEFNNDYSVEELKNFEAFSNFDNIQQIFNYLKTNLNHNNIIITEENNMLKILINIQLNILLFLLPVKSLEQKEINKLLFNNIANVNITNEEINKNIKFLINKVLDIEKILAKKLDIEINKNIQTIKMQLKEENEKILNEELKKIKKLEEDKLNELKKKEEELNNKFEKLKIKEDYINQEIADYQKFAEGNKMFENDEINEEENNTNIISNINLTAEELKEENIKSWKEELQKGI